jgi:hypothetical protein
MVRIEWMGIMGIDADGLLFVGSVLGKEREEVVDCAEFNGHSISPSPNSHARQLTNVFRNSDVPIRRGPDTHTVL